LERKKKEILEGCHRAPCDCNGIGIRSGRPEGKELSLAGCSLSDYKHKIVTTARSLIRLNIINAPFR
jgi:hypothetical protein